MGRRRYSAEKIGRTRALLQSNAGYVKPTAKTEQVGQMTVTRWRDGIYPPHVTAAEVEGATDAARKDLAELWGKVANAGAAKALDLLGGTKSARDAALVGAIGTDKHNLLTGHPTDRIQVQDLASFLGSKPSSVSHVRTPDVPAREQPPLH